MENEWCEGHSRLEGIVCMACVTRQSPTLLHLRYFDMRGGMSEHLCTALRCGTGATLNQAVFGF